MRRAGIMADRAVLWMGVGLHQSIDFRPCGPVANSERGKLELRAGEGLTCWRGVLVLVAAVGPCDSAAPAELDDGVSWYSPHGTRRGA